MPMSLLQRFLLFFFSLLFILLTLSPSPQYKKPPKVQLFLNLTGGLISLSMWALLQVQRPEPSSHHRVHSPLVDTSSDHAECS